VQGLRRGTHVRHAEPVWEPLIELVGMELVGDFMWMHGLELDDGLEVHAYKNIGTRRYLHLGVDGRAFLYGPGGQYWEITTAAAVEAALGHREDLLPEPPDVDALRALLARHRAALR
jgi:hypothetical protein